MNFSRDRLPVDTSLLLDDSEQTLPAREKLLQQLGWSDAKTAARRLASFCHTSQQKQVLRSCLDTLLFSMSESANPDHSLLNFERYLQSYSDHLEPLHFLAEHPRAVEILVKLFVGSQFLTEILLRNPGYLEQLTSHKRLAEFKSRDDFLQEALRQTSQTAGFYERINQLRNFQHWELLRIGACDSFGLMDFKTVTLQLSLLADALVQACLLFAAEKVDIEPAGFVVLAFGKLGGEEINYSSDIDLVFVADQDASRFWALGQSLIEGISKSTADGFLYRVDMRLRPWGRSGALVCSSEAYLDYLQKHAQLWEKQALLKARPIAGEISVGQQFLKKAESTIFQTSAEQIRLNVRQMKLQIEKELKKQGRVWGEVKGGRGSIRDIEFTVQSLQLIHGRAHPAVRSANTMDGLVRLVEQDLISAAEYRQLSDAYVFLRTIEHALQLTHYKQIHHLPAEPRELAYLARKLDFPDAQTLVSYYEQHGVAVRKIFDKYLETEFDEQISTQTESLPAIEQTPKSQPDYLSTFSEDEVQSHLELLKSLGEQDRLRVLAEPLAGSSWKLTILGWDVAGQFSVTCGLLFASGCNIKRGEVFTGLFSQQAASFSQGEGSHSRGQNSGRGCFLTVLVVTVPRDLDEQFWTSYSGDFKTISGILYRGNLREAQAVLARKIGQALQAREGDALQLLPVELNIDNELDPQATVMDISGEDVPGFLYELATGLALSGLRIERVTVNSAGNRVADRLYVTDEKGNKITESSQLQMLRAMVMLIKHFVHLLPNAPNPVSALLHFRDLLEQLFEQPDWLEQLSNLEKPRVLDALAKVLGVSDFLWEDFLRLQYSNLFPVVTDVEGLTQAKSRLQLNQELSSQLEAADTREAQMKILNNFKDREMLRTDMRHILGYEETFGQFSLELTNIAEVVIEQAVRIVWHDLSEKYGEPELDAGQPCRYCIVALGKCGGRELGFASDIELMFIYEGAGESTRSDRLSNHEFFQQLVEGVRALIRAKRDGIFEIDLRLRPYGRAGSLSVSYQAFGKYFSPEGPAWPYERQALVKLRPILGDPEFCQQLVDLRDCMIYTGEPFDVASMRAIREKQVRQLVTPGTIHAKLSPGGLVDCEYLVQGLQISYGKQFPQLRTTNTREALRKLESTEILSRQDRVVLRDCYRFLRNLIDALRMVRGDARDLTIPPFHSEEFVYLARRLGYRSEPRKLAAELEQVMQTVQEYGRLLVPLFNSNEKSPSA